jgi:hypothetical protein
MGYYKDTCITTYNMNIIILLTLSLSGNHIMLVETTQKWKREKIAKHYEPFILTLYTIPFYSDFNIILLS